MSPLEVALLVATGACCMALGLYMGERGRRIDAQVREGKLPQPLRSRPVVTRGDPSPIGLEDEPEGEGLDVVKERLVESAMAEGYSRADAEADADRCIAQLHQMGG